LLPEDLRGGELGHHGRNLDHGVRLGGDGRHERVLEVGRDLQLVVGVERRVVGDGERHLGDGHERLAVALVEVGDLHDERLVGLRDGLGARGVVVDDAELGDGHVRLAAEARRERPHVVGVRLHGALGELAEGRRGAVLGLGDGEDVADVRLPARAVLEGV